MKDNTTTVSVIIPCYNDSRYLQEAVYSVLSSTYRAIQIIIVDDGSTDETRKIALQLQNKNPDVIKYIFQENSGLSSARNNGISLAKGKYILPLDADDKISSGYITEAVKVLENKPEVKVVYCNARFFGKKEGAWKLKPFSRKVLPRENVIFCAALYRKTDWEKVGGYSIQMKYGWEDWEFWISILKTEGEVYKLPLIGFYYRIKCNSMRKAMTKEKKAELIKFMNQKHKDFFFETLGGPLRTSRGMSRFINFFANCFK